MRVRVSPALPAKKERKMIVLNRYPRTDLDENCIVKIGEFPDLIKAGEKVKEYCADGVFSEREFFTIEVRS